MWKARQFKDDLKSMKESIKEIETMPSRSLRVGIPQDLCLVRAQRKNYKRRIP